MKRLLFKVGLSGGFFLCLLAARATTFELIIDDPAGFGFNSTDPAVAGTDNPGTTLGEQRVIVLQRAADIWGMYLQSDVPIRILARFEDFGGSADGVTLAGAGPITVHQDFTNAPVPDTWYPAALANSLAGEDLAPADADINVTVNIAPDVQADIPDWYYGLDGNPPGEQFDLLDVLLHELGHGLGFISLADDSNGQWFGIGPASGPDIFSRFLYDTETLEAWETMTNRERSLSAINDPNLVWTGDYSTAASTRLLELKRVIQVNAPGGIAGEYDYTPALFGPPVPAEGISGTLVIVDDGTGPTTDACEPIQNTADLAGNIAYIDRGSCNFDAKVLNAQQNGAIAVIIANNVEGLIQMVGQDVVDGIPLTIPAVSITLADGQTLFGASPGVDLTIGVVDTEGFSGSNEGFVRMHAPNPVAPGSSVSHWTPDTAPDLLMEPFISPDLRDDLDLSLTLMKDIGWLVIDIPFPYLTYALWVQETFPAGAVLTAETEDADSDGVLNIEEYFFDADPLVPSVLALPVLERSGTDLDFTYTRTRLATDLAYAYEVSTDMTGWTDAIEGIDYTEELVVQLGDAAEEVRLRVTEPPPGQKIFVRLRIVSEPGD